MHSVSRLAVGHRFFPRAVVRLSVLVLSVCLSGCGTAFVKSLQDLAQLRTQLMAEFHENEIAVRVGNSTQLSITFVNSALNDRLPEDRAKRAQATALFVKQHFAGIDRMERIWVFFATYETRYLVVHYSRSVDMFLFDRKGTRIELGTGYGAPADAIPDATRNTDVALRIQLAGNMNKGLALFPSFAGGSEGTPPHRAPTPAKVVFTFASYAPEKVFKTDIPFALIADGKTVYRSMTLNTSKTVEGGNEFLTQEIPYFQFVELVQARQATLKLADREYRLTDEQLSRLREMAGVTSTHG